MSRADIAPHLRLVHDAATVDRYVAQPPRRPRPTSWTDLYLHQGPGCRDARNMAATLTKLGLHPHAVHGLDEHNRCTCGRSDCRAPGKHPVCAGWQSCALDPAALDQMLARDWRLNLGLRMGVQPRGFRLVAIDCDGPMSLLGELEDRNGRLPVTLTAQTSRGFHLLYKVPHDLNVPNRVRIADHVDVRSDGGQIVVSPSRHASGAFYQWINACEPAELPL